MDYKRKFLEKLAGAELDDVLGIIDTPGRATRAGIYAAQTDQDILDAITAQFSGDRPDAPTGAQIADKVSEDYDIENPVVLAGIATASEVLDPTTFIPGGQVGKFGKVMKAVSKNPEAAKVIKAFKKPLSKMYKVDDAVFPAKNAAEAMNVRKGLEQTNKVRPNRAIQELSDPNLNVPKAIEGTDTLRAAKFSGEEWSDIMDQFPQVMRQKKFGGTK